MLESITYTGKAYEIKEGELSPDAEPVEISGTFEVIDIDSNERGTAYFVQDENEQEYMIDGADMNSAYDLDIDDAFPDEEE